MVGIRTTRVVVVCATLALLACDPGGDGEVVARTGRVKSLLVPQVALDGASIPKYVDAVPTFAGHRSNGSETQVIRMMELQQKVLPAAVYASLPAPFDAGTYVWGYKVNNFGPSWPATTIEAKRGNATTAIYFNELRRPDGSPPVLQKYLTVDQTIHWADVLGITHASGCMNGPPLATPCLEPYQGPVPATVHLHGGEVLSAYDGHPDSWFSPGFEYRGPAFVTNTYNYPNQQEATTLWFHDHSLGTTRLNVFSGLAGFYLLRDGRDTGLPGNAIGLPTGRYEQELLIQDRQFDSQGQLLFPDGHPEGLNGPAPNPDRHPSWNPEFFGDVITVNGKSWPFLDVEPRRYRFRLLNAANARFFQMQLIDAADGGAGPAVWQIGSDGGFLNAPVRLADAAKPGSAPLVLGPAERADVIVDFAGRAGKTFVLVNTANAPFPDGDPVDPNTAGQIMQFRVNVRLRGMDTSYNPAAPKAALRVQPIVRLDPAVTGKPADARRQLVLVEAETPGTAAEVVEESPEEGGPVEVLLNNSRWHGLREGSEPPTPIPGSIANASGVHSTENPRVGSTEIWELANLTDDAHPIHIHLVQFQIIDRQDLDVVGYRAAWEGTFPGGTFAGISYPPGVFIPGYGPPGDYAVPNAAGAIGGNPDLTPHLAAPPVPPGREEAGWKDTVRVPPGKVTRLVVRWAPTHVPVSQTVAGTSYFPFDPTTGGPGYVWHCHILDHEDNEMMRPYLVVK